MAPGLLLDLNAPDNSSSGLTGSHPLLSRGQLIGMRILVVIYVLTFALLTATSVPFVSRLLFRLIDRYVTARFVLALMVSASAITFVLLLGLCLYHYLRGHLGPRPARFWLWVILLLNVVGVVIYYMRVIEPEHGGRHPLEGR